ncbi:MAG: hypothetical protein LBH21_06145 [Gracilibacteraceae bacterium]|nr:hypothetical protein [Gracilibacteraceae bacterium]
MKPLYLITVVLLLAAGVFQQMALHRQSQVIDRQQAALLVAEGRIERLSASCAEWEEALIRRVRELTAQLPADQPAMALSDDDRERIASVVTRETGGQSLEPAVLVAQAILNGLVRAETPAADFLQTRQLDMGGRPEPTQVAYIAVSLVFDYAFRLTSEPIEYWYSPAVSGTSSFHESQRYVLTDAIGHRFFAAAVKTAE